MARVSVLVAAGGDAWETRALERLATVGSGAVLLKRCVDLNDLIASATTGQAAVALVSLGLPGLDADSVSLLHRSGVGVVAVAETAELRADEEQRAARWGVHSVLPDDALDGIPQVVVAAAAEVAPPPVRADAGASAPTDEGPSGQGRLVTIWGPSGAPGRTTLAVTLASELARREHEAFLLDADPYGGAVAQHLGLLEEVSGLLGAVRMANAGQLDGVRLAALARQVTPSFRVLTGLPRPDRWREVRDSAFETLLDQARALGEYVVVDTGFSLEDDPVDPFGAPGPRRNATTLEAVAASDELVVVGSADPVGLARLARGLVDLVELLSPSSAPRVHVVVNRSRRSLGWRERDVRGMVEGFLTPASMHFLPEDRAAADRALVTGSSVVEAGDSSLRRAFVPLADALVCQPASTQRRRLLSRRR